jgi:hypothetical protein
MQTVATLTRINIKAKGLMYKGMANLAMVKVAAYNNDTANKAK